MMPCRHDRKAGSRKPPSWSSLIAFGVALAVLISAGWAYRLLAQGIAATSGQPLATACPLASLPMRIGEWQGQDVPLDENMRQIAAEDDYVNRQYTNARLGRAVRLYVGYIGRPRSWLGHRPDLCYPAHGWKRISEEKFVVETEARGEVPGLLYEFRAPEAGGARELVLATYLVNGVYSNDSASFADVNRRAANLAGNSGAYVARIQIALNACGDRKGDLTVLSDFASALVEPIATLMPYVEGRSRSDSALHDQLGNLETCSQKDKLTIFASQR
jgi:hypothetical protein